MDLHLELQSDGKEILVLERSTAREVEPMIRTSPANHASPSIEMVERSTVAQVGLGSAPLLLMSHHSFRHAQITST